MSSKNKPSKVKPAAEKPEQIWHVIKNTVTGEKSITDEKSWKYAQKHEPKAKDWKKVSKHTTEEEAISAL